MMTSGEDEEVTEQDLAIMEQLSGRILEEQEKLGDQDATANLFQAYPMLGDYADQDKGVELKAGDVVEVLDSERSDAWLVRKQAQSNKVGPEMFCVNYTCA